MDNTELRKIAIDEITKHHFEQAIYLAYRDGITGQAPLGFSGDTIILFGEDRKSQVSIRNYCNDAELLICDARGNFLFLGRYDINLGIDFVVDQYWEIFNKVKSSIEIVLPEISQFANVKVNDRCAVSDGFAMLLAYHKLGNIN